MIIFVNTNKLTLFSTYFIVIIFSPDNQLSTIKNVVKFISKITYI